MTRKHFAALAYAAGGIRLMAGWQAHYIPDAADIESALYERGYVVEDGQALPRCPYGDHASGPYDDCREDWRPDRTDEVRERRLLE